MQNYVLMYLKYDFTQTFLTLNSTKYFQTDHKQSQGDILPH